MKTKFWHRGLKFQCQRCGNCCIFPGGSVNASETEFLKIAESLHIPFESFLSRYTEEKNGLVSIKSYSHGPCVFYDNGCTIYEVRPSQCRTFPFWPIILKSETRWIEQAQSCHGINHGKTWSKEEIQQQLKAARPDLMAGSGEL